MISSAAAIAMLTLLENITNRQYFQAWAIFSSVVFISYYRWPGRRLDHIPAVGSSSQILSFIGAFEFLFRARDVLQRGCDQYHDSIFRVPNLDRWMVLVHGPRFIEEMKSVPGSTLSSIEPFEELIQTEFTLGSNISTVPYHVPIIRSQLTRNLSALFPAVYEEVVDAFDQLVPARENEWLKLKVMEAMTPIICRASNCVFVGVPLCRDPDYIDLNFSFTITVIKAATILRFFPPFLKPIVAPFLTNLSSSIGRGVKHLQPLIEEHRRQREEYGNDFPDKPNDFLSWLMDEATGDETTILNLTRRILALNFTTIHTSSMTFTHALYYLAEYPEHAQTLREEIQEIVYREGWTYAAITKMVKVDSFIKESQRLNSFGCVSMSRVAREPFIFSDGTCLPKGTFIAVPAHAIHLDDSNYPDPTSFVPFRFVDKAKESTGRKVDMTATHTDFLSFGNGRHACPGRFFAATMLKLMLALLVMKYDVKLEGPRPENLWIVTSCVPNPKGEVLFRKRAAARD